jgi:hypothetical protein
MPKIIAGFKSMMEGRVWDIIYLSREIFTTKVNTGNIF